MASLDTIFHDQIVAILAMFWPGYGFFCGYIEIVAVLWQRCSYIEYAYIYKDFFGFYEEIGKTAI